MQELRDQQRAENAARVEESSERRQERLQEQAKQRQARELEKAARVQEKMDAKGQKRADELQPGDRIKFGRELVVESIEAGKLGLKIKCDKTTLRGIAPSTAITVL